MEAISIAGSLLISIKITRHHISKEFYILPISLYSLLCFRGFLVASIILVWLENQGKRVSRIAVNNCKNWLCNCSHLWSYLALILHFMVVKLLPCIISFHPYNYVSMTLDKSFSPWPCFPFFFFFIYLY